jgi:hypothetical protein
MSLVSDRNGRVTREGPFWDVMEGRAAPPPAAVLLGWELIAVDPGSARSRSRLPPASSS